MLTVDALKRAAIASALPKTLDLGAFGSATRLTSEVVRGVLRVVYRVPDGRLVESHLRLDKQDADAPSPAWVARTAAMLARFNIAALLDDESKAPRT